MDYYGYLQSVEWKEKRKQLVDFAGGRCQLCNSNAGAMHCHHRTYTNLGHETLADLTLLCAACHKKFHGSKGAGALKGQDKQPRKARDKRGFDPALVKFLHPALMTAMSNAKGKKPTTKLAKVLIKAGILNRPPRQGSYRQVYDDLSGRLYMAGYFPEHRAAWNSLWGMARRNATQGKVEL